MNILFNLEEVEDAANIIQFLWARGARKQSKVAIFTLLKKLFKLFSYFNNKEGVI